MKTIQTPPTRQLQEQINKPLHAQKDENKIKEETKEKDDKPLLTFDDTNEKPLIYGNDLQIPAFIRRQHD